MVHVSKGAQRYALSLYSVAQETQEEASSFEELTSFLTMVRKHSALEVVFKNPLIGKGEMKKILGDVSQRIKLSPLVSRFLCVLASAGRLKELESVVESYKDVFNKSHKASLVSVTVSQALSVDQKKRLETIMEKKLGSRVSFETVLDPEILGGLIIQVGPYRLDSSLRTKIQKLKHFLERTV